ncbi:MAG: DMT family transporter [Chlorobi bacterium]|nr:DMT family transporter [Chlorobiota bacterium]
MQYIGEIFALMTAVMWSVTSIVFTEASVRVGSSVVNITRLVLAAVYLSVTILIFGFPFNVNETQIVFLSASGIIGLVVGDGFLFKSFQYVGARISMLMMSLVPPVSALLAFFLLGESIAIVGIAGIFVTIMGVAIVILQKGVDKNFSPHNKVKGIIFAVFGAIGQAVGLIFAKLAFHEGEINGFVATFIRLIPATLILLVYLLSVNHFKNPFAKYKNNFTAFKFTLVGSFVGPFLGITFSLIAVAHAKVGIASTLMATAPVIMLPLVKIYYKQDLNFKSIGGAFLAVAGIAILFLK